MKRDYIDFQDRSKPLAFLITFRGYGTWLHGDSRGSMDRRKYNRYGTPDIPLTPKWKTLETANLAADPVEFRAPERRLIEEAIREVCLFRKYTLYGLNVRTNHAHSVVYGDTKPERIMDAFKAYSTRRLRENGLVNVGQKVWSRHGSTRYLWTERHVEIAVDYVVSGQGTDLPKFD